MQKKAFPSIRNYRGIKAMPILIGHSPNSAPFATYSEECI